MAYIPKEWQNFREGGTALDADALVDMETRLSNYVDAAIAAIPPAESEGAWTRTDAGGFVNNATIDVPADAEEIEIVCNLKLESLGGIAHAETRPPGATTGMGDFYGVGAFAQATTDAGTSPPFVTPVTPYSSAGTYGFPLYLANGAYGARCQVWSSSRIVIATGTARNSYTTFSCAQLNGTFQKIGGWLQGTWQDLATEVPQLYLALGWGVEVGTIDVRTVR